MINKSSKGSISFFFENRLIASVPINEKYTVNDWMKHGSDLIVDGMRDGSSLKFIKTALFKCIHKMKLFDNKLNYADNVFVAQAMMGLIKLNLIDPDGDGEGLFIQPLKKSVNHR